MGSKTPVYTNLWVGARLFAKYDSTKGTLFVHGDNIGSATTLTGPTSAAVQGETFYPWGVQWATGGTLGEEHFAAFHQRDPGTGLDYTLNRMYTSTQGRWLTPDPGGVKVVSLEDPQTWNLYSYVRDTPLASTDPLGLSNEARYYQVQALLQGHAMLIDDNEKPWDDPATTGPNVNKQEKDQQAVTSAAILNQQKKKAPAKKPPKQKVAVVVGKVEALHPAPFTPGVNQQDVTWTARLMRGNAIVGELPNARISLTERKGEGNDKDMRVCSTACTEVGSLEDTEHVSAAGLWQTVNQSFAVNGQPVSAIVIRADGTVVAQGSVIQVTVTASGSTFQGQP